MRVRVSVWVRVRVTVTVTVTVRVKAAAGLLRGGALQPRLQLGLPRNHLLSNE